MDDSQICPICGVKFRNLYLKNYQISNKTADFVERTCSQSMNHIIQFYADQSTNQIDYIKLNINPRYTVILELDFINKKSIMSFWKSGACEYVHVPKIIEPDFPLLNDLREKINMYTVFL